MPQLRKVGHATQLHVDDKPFLVLGGELGKPADGKGQVGIEQVQEGSFDGSGMWRGGRWLNGDETHQGRHVRLYDGRWSVQRVKLYRYR